MTDINEQIETLQESIEEKTRNAYNHGYSLGQYSGRQEWKWDQYFASVLFTILGTMFLFGLGILAFQFIHWAAQPDQTVQSTPQVLQCDVAPSQDGSGGRLVCH